MLNTVQNVSKVGTLYDNYCSYAFLCVLGGFTKAVFAMHDSSIIR